MPDWVVLFAGIAAAALGGNAFVRGAVGVAGWLRVPPGIIGATVAAFATSTPEFSVAMNAASEGQPEIPLGDAIGSNVVNVGLILGLAITIAPIAAARADVRRDFPFALLAPLLTGLLVINGNLGRVDGGVLLAVFATWLAIAVLQAHRARNATARIIGEARPAHALANTLVGVGLLVVAGRLIVLAATGIGEDLGIDSFIVGATLVAIGTSAPELATALIAGIRGHPEIGLGTIVGSNIFNNLWIVGVTALIVPIDVDRSETSVALVASILVLLLAIPAPSGLLGRRRGRPLIAAYALYLGALLALA